MADSFVRTRCSWCNAALGFEEWSSGATVCRPCATSQHRPRERAETASARTQAAAAAPDYERLLADVPEDTVEELLAALEAELARQAPAPTARPRSESSLAQPSVVTTMLDEAGIGRSPREVSWAAWGFAGGFVANVVLAKLVQMESGAPVTEFLAPMVLGGLLCGGACAAIGWGLARLRGV